MKRSDCAFIFERHSTQVCMLSPDMLSVWKGDFIGRSEAKNYKSYIKILMFINKVKVSYENLSMHNSLWNEWLHIVVALWHFLFIYLFIYMVILKPQHGYNAFCWAETTQHLRHTKILTYIVNYNDTNLGTYDITQ